MKQLKVILPAALMGLMVGLASCDKEAQENLRDDNNGGGDGGGNPGSQPEISFIKTPDNIAQSGDSVTFTLTITSSTNSVNLKSLKMEVLRKTTGGTFNAKPGYTKTKQFSNIPKTATTMGFRIKNGDFNSTDSVKAKFTLKDQENKSVAKSKVIALGSIMPDRYVAAGGDTVIEIRHKFTSKQPSDNKFDLYYYENNNTVGYVDPGGGDKATIMDDSPNDSTFNRQWTTTTSASFVKANNADINFNKPFDINVAKAYNQGNSSKSVINIAQDDLIIVKLRNQGRFALLKIVNVVPDQQNPAASYISFKGKGSDDLQ